MAELRAAAGITRSPCLLVQWEAWNGLSPEFGEFARERLGGYLPGEIGEVRVVGAVTAVKAAPRRFWLFGNDPDDLPCGLPPALGAEVDLREGRERILVRSPRLRDILAQCLAVDWDTTLDRAIFAPMHRIPVMFTRNSADEGTFVVPRTFSRSIVDWLEAC